MADPTEFLRKPADFSVAASARAVDNLSNATPVPSDKQRLSSARAVIEIEKKTSTLESMDALLSGATGKPLQN